ncbi:MAG: hypothetical protein AAB047_02300, partial [Nitrospirota bacterium]
MTSAQALREFRIRSQDSVAVYIVMVGGSGFVLLSGYSKVQWCVVMLVLIVSCLVVGDAVAQITGIKVKTIEIRGNKRIELPAIAG